MNTLSSAEEKRLLNAVETVLSLADKGTAPDDAMYKVAEEGKFTPPFVHRIAEAFNVVRTSRTLKEASAEKRTANFGLVDPDAVVKRLYPTGEEKTAELKPLVFPKMTGKSEVMQKVASAVTKTEWFTNASPETILRSISKCRDAHDLMNRRLATKEAALKEELDGQLDKLSYEVRKLPKTGLQKMAQLVVNGFPSTGKSFLKLLAQRSGMDIPMAEKTAEAAVFPLRDPYFLIAQVHDTASRYLRANQTTVGFSKYAEGLVDDLAKVVGTAASEGLGGLKAGDNTDKKERIIGEELDPQFFNALKEVGTRKSFMNLALYDPDLKEYDAQTLLGAFNSAVSSVPESAENPSVLKTLMLQRINTGGINDTFQATQEAALGKTLRDKTTSARAAAAPKPRPAEVPSLKLKTDNKDSIIGKLLTGSAKATSALIKPSEEGDKKDAKNLEDLEKAYGGELNKDKELANKERMAGKFVDTLMKGVDPANYEQIVNVNNAIPELQGISLMEAADILKKAQMGEGDIEQAKRVAKGMADLRDHAGRKGKGKEQ